MCFKKTARRCVNCRVMWQLRALSGWVRGGKGFVGFTNPDTSAEADVGSL